MHEAHHIANAVHCRHLFLNATQFIVEHLHRMWQVQIISYGVRLVGELRLQVFRNGQTVGNILDEVGNDVSALVDPRLMTGPMAVEVALHLLHLLLGGRLGIFLHARVECGIDLQSAVVKVIAVILTPSFKMLCDGIAEVKSLTVVVLFYAKVEGDGNTAEGVVFSFREMPMCNHVAKHQVATLQAAVGVRDGIVGSGGLEHSHQNGRLLQLEILRRGVEIGLASRLDAKCIRTEVDGVGIHREDFFLRIEVFEFQRHEPLFRLRDDHAQSRNAAERTSLVLRAHLEHVLRQLLRDGRSTTGVIMKNGVLGGSKHAKRVDAYVTIEAFVLSIDEHAPEVGVHFLILHRRTILAEVFANQHAVGAIDFRCLADLRFKA